LIWGISRRPTRFQAAVEADRQLDLNDLLGTVLLLGRDDRSTDAWKESLASISDARCRSLRPSAVVVNRLGLRAWGGVGVLGALLFTFGLFTARPVDVAAAPPSTSTSISLLPSNPLNSSEPIARTNSRPPGPGGVDDDSNRSFDLNRLDDSSTAGNNDQSHSANFGANHATGGGMAVTHNVDAQHASSTIQETGGDLSRSGPTAAGMGNADSRGGASGDSASSTASPSGQIPDRAPPWKSDQWTRSAEAAQAAINSGRVPDADADLVRDYFQRD
jgi:hypothetical protein